MADQIVLAWAVDITGTPLGLAGAAAALGAVPLYENAETDPVLGQLFGLKVATDVSAPSGPSEVTRTLTLNMTSNVLPQAPPAFPCRPDTATPPVLPYTLRRAVTLSGEFFVSNGSATVPTTGPQVQTLTAGDTIQFLSQQGVYYTILTVTDTDITLTVPYTGVTGSTGAFRLVAAPVVRAAVYSSSDLDTGDVAGTVPPIPNTVPPLPIGPGGQEVEISYMDSTGGGPFTTEATLTGRRPSAIPLAPGSIDIAEIVDVFVEGGAFGGSIGQVTIVELSSDLPGLPLNATPDDYRGKLTDAAQLLITRHLVYLPPSYFALAQQQASFPQLEGDFFVTTGSTRVETSEDQTLALSAGDVIRFASQLANNTPLETRAVAYTIEDVGPKGITLTTPYTGVDDNFTGTQNLGVNSNRGTKGNVGSEVLKKATAAFLIDPSNAAPPTNDQLAGPLAQFVEPTTAGPPPVLVPTFLSDLFTRTLQNALAGVPIEPQEIVFI